MANIDMWDWTQKIRSYRFDSYLNTTKLLPLQQWCGAAGRQRNILLGQSPGMEKTLRPGWSQRVALTERISLPTCYFWYFMYGWESQSNWRYFGRIPHPPRKGPVPHSSPSITALENNYLEHKLKEFNKRQVIIISYELQPHKASAKPSEESFHGLFQSCIINQ